MNRKRLISIIFWLIAFALLGLVLRNVSLTAVLHSLQQLTCQQIIALIGLNALILVLLTARWWLILWGLGYKLPFGLTVGHRLAAFGVSYFTPGPQFGGEPVQVLLVEKVHDVPRITAVSSVTLDKTLELLVNFSFLALGVVVILQSQFLGDGLGWQTATFSILLFSLPVLYLVSLWRGNQPIAGFMRLSLPVFGRRLAWSNKFETAIQSMATSEKQAGEFYHESPAVVWSALNVSVLGWVMMVVEFGTMLTFLGANVSFLQAIMILTAVRFAFLLPLPGGLGTVEAALVWALTQLGFNPAVGLSASLLIRGRDVLLGLLGLWWGNYFLSRLLRQPPQKEVSDDQFT